MRQSGYTYGGRRTQPAAKAKARALHHAARSAWVSSRRPSNRRAGPLRAIQLTHSRHRASSKKKYSLFESIDPDPARKSSPCPLTYRPRSGDAGGRDITVCVRGPGPLAAPASGRQRLVAAAASPTHEQGHEGEMPNIFDRSDAPAAVGRPIVRCGEAGRLSNAQLRAALGPGGQSSSRIAHTKREE